MVRRMTRSLTKSEVGESDIRPQERTIAAWNKPIRRLRVNVTNPDVMEI